MRDNFPRFPHELVAAHDSASNRRVNVEGMTEEELKIIQKYYSKLSEFAKKQDTLAFRRILVVEINR